MRSIYTLFALLFVLSTVLSQDLGTIQNTTCFLEDCSFMQSHPDTRFGYITVPEDYDKPEGKTLQIAFSVLKTPNPNFKGDPIIVFAGGWGLPLVHKTSNYVRFPFLKERDVILFDYRGSGFSNKLPCDNMGEQSWEEIITDMPYSQFINNLTKRFENCMDQLVSQGIDINQYGMNTIARDAAYLAQQLEYDTYNLFGVSYGTMAIQHFLRAATLYDISVRSVVLDSNVPIGEATQGSMALYYARSLNNIMEDCAANADCNEAYPNLKSRFLAFLNSLEETPLVLQLADGTTAFLNKEELNAVVHQIIYHEEVYKDVPIFLERLIARDAKAFQPILKIMKDRVHDSFNALGLIEYTYDYKGAIEQSKAAFAEVQQKYKPYELVEAYYEFYMNDTRIKTDSIAITPIKTDVPSLLLAGTYDPITPPEWNDNFRKQFDNHYYYVFPKVGHGVVFTTCGLEITQQFIANPTQQPDAACLEQAENKTISFRTDYYKNTNLSSLVTELSTLQPLWLVIALALTVLVLLVNVIIGIIRMFKKRKRKLAPSNFIASLLGLLFVVGVGYFISKTVSSDIFLLGFGLVAEVKWIIYLAPLFIVGTLYYLYRIIQLRNKNAWHILSSIVFLFLVGFIFYTELYPNF
jgi:pimeloyl-ACP methyl ester carboxylesterase